MAKLRSENHCTILIIYYLICSRNVECSQDCAQKNNCKRNVLYIHIYDNDTYKWLYVYIIYINFCPCLNSFIALNASFAGEKPKSPWGTPWALRPLLLCEPLDGPSQPSHWSLLGQGWWRWIPWSEMNVSHWCIIKSDAFSFYWHNMCCHCRNVSCNMVF